MEKFISVLLLSFIGNLFAFSQNIFPEISVEGRDATTRFSLKNPALETRDSLNNNFLIIVTDESTPDTTLPMKDIAFIHIKIGRKAGGNDICSNSFSPRTPGIVANSYNYEIIRNKHNINMRCNGSIQESTIYFSVQLESNLGTFSSSYAGTISK